MLVPLTRGEYAIIDAADADVIGRYNWHVNNFGYAVNKDLGVMHRYLLDAPPDREVDHGNHNTLDNRRSNIRVCTSSENKQNSRKHRNPVSRSKFKGVRPSSRRWLATIMVDRKIHRLGSFATEEDAARAYDEAAIKHFGEFACPNFPRE